MTLDDLLADPSKLGVVTLMAIAITAFMRGWIVTAAQYDAMRKERDEFKQMIISAAETTDRALKVAQARTPTVE